MGDALSLLVGGPHLFYVVFAGILCVVLEIFVPYQRYVSVLKWLTLSLTFPRFSGHRIKRLGALLVRG